ncbi:MAG: TIGR00268 family protein, partial [Elusimicrobia bacterium CG_4_10_14_0_8_um_filter_37_32]
VKHLVITTKELLNPRFIVNPANRCYYCKKELFTELKQIALKKGINYVVDGTNCDDLKDFRPGQEAIKALGVRSPLREVGLTKKEIRGLSRKMNLDTWDKPAFACLSSRLPYGTPIDKKKLQMVGEAEDYLFKSGFKQVRVRHHNNIARIEVSPEDIEHLTSINLRRKIVKKLKEIGYHYVTLDLQGYRTGSMNEVLERNE